MIAVPVTARCATDGSWWALNRRDQGWASYGYKFAFLGDLLDALGGRIVGWGTDKVGVYLLVEVSR